MRTRCAAAAPRGLKIGLHLVVAGPGLVLVERCHEGLAVDRVAENLLLHLLFVGEARVVVEGVVRHRGALGKTSAQVVVLTAIRTPEIGLT